MSETRRVHSSNLTREIGNPDLYRTAASVDDDGLTIEGYWAVFNSPTVIDSWEGTFREEAAPGAYKRTLRERGPIMQFDHGLHPLLGSLPLGRWTESYEDDHGAFSRGRLSDNWLVQPFRDAILDGGVKGMSYRFAVVRDEWRDAEGKKVKPDDVPARIYATSMSESDLLTRTILEAKVSEAGPVVWPAYAATSVGVRSSRVVIDLGRLHEPEQRKTLATAILAADAAELRGDPEGTQTTSKAETADAPPATGHPSGPVTEATPDAPLVTEHPSAPTPTDSRTALRTQARELSEYVRNIKRGATRHGG